MTAREGDEPRICSASSEPSQSRLILRPFLQTANSKPYTGPRLEGILPSPGPQQTLLTPLNGPVGPLASNMYIFTHSVLTCGLLAAQRYSNVHSIYNYELRELWGRARLNSFANEFTLHFHYITSTLKTTTRTPVCLMHPNQTSVRLCC